MQESFVGIDMCISEDDGKIYLIDINYFPSYTNTFNEVDNLSNLINKELQNHYEEFVA